MVLCISIMGEGHITNHRSQTTGLLSSDVILLEKGIIMKKGAAVFFNCENPAIGHIKRLSKDKSWADVEWHYGVGCIGTNRVYTKHLILLMPALNKITKKVRI